MRLVRVAVAALSLTVLLAAPASAGDLASITKTDAPDPVAPGGTITYTITVQNLSGGDLTGVEVNDVLPSGITFQSLAAPAGWSAAVPLVGTNGTVTMTIATLAAASGPQVSTLVVNTHPLAPGGSLVGNVAVLTATSPTLSLPAQTQTTIAGGAASVVPSVPDAAMPPTASGSPWAVLGFGAVVLALLTGFAVLSRRRAP